MYFFLITEKSISAATKLLLIFINSRFTSRPVAVLSPGVSTVAGKVNLKFTEMNFNT